MELKQVYTARDSMDAHFVRGLLEQEGIEAVVQGEALEETWGDLNLSRGSLPTVWVKENDAARAASVVEQYKRVDEANADVADGDQNRPARPMWTCPRCGQQVEDQFGKCWKCGTHRPPGEQAVMDGPH